VEDAHREAARKADIDNGHDKSPVVMPDLHAMLLASDASRRANGLPPHTLETFLRDLHM
jgi:hypothetical protein